MKLRPWVACLLLGAGAAGCPGWVPNDVHEEQVRKLEDMNRALSAELGKSKQNAQILEDILKAEQIDKKKYQRLYQEQERLSRELQAMMDSLKSQVATEEGFEVDGYRIRMTDVLFDSGSDTLKPRAQAKLKEIATTLKEQGRTVRVEGHTDGQPIVKTKDKFDDNWDLSSQRALTVLRFLQGAGMPGESLEIGAYGEFRPMPGQKNAPDRGTPKNRRVEIVILK